MGLVQFMLGSTDSAAALKAGNHHPGDSGFQNSLGVRQRIVQAGTFFEFRLVDWGFVGQQMRRGAALGAHGIHLKRQLSHAADW